MKVADLIPVAERTVQIVYKENVDSRSITKEYFYGDKRAIPYYLLDGTVLRIKSDMSGLQICINEQEWYIENER